MFGVRLFGDYWAKLGSSTDLTSAAYYTSYDALMRYIPNYIDKDNDIFKAIVAAICNQCAELQNGINGLSDINYKTESLRVTADAITAFFDTTAEDVIIRQEVIDAVTINHNRGLYDYIASEAAKMPDFEEPPELTPAADEEAGLILDVTYPDSEFAYLDSRKIIKMIVTSAGLYGYGEYDTTRYGQATEAKTLRAIEKLKKYAIPFDVFIALD